MQYISLLYVEQVEKIAAPGSIKQGILSPEKQITHRLPFEELHRGLRSCVLRVSIITKS